MQTGAARLLAASTSLVLLAGGLISFTGHTATSVLIMTGFALAAVATAVFAIGFTLNEYPGPVLFLAAALPPALGIYILMMHVLRDAENGPAGVFLIILGFVVGLYALFGGRRTSSSAAAKPEQKPSAHHAA